MKSPRQNTDTLDMIGVLVGYDNGMEQGGIKALGLATPLDLNTGQACIEKDLGVIVVNPDGIALAPTGQNTNAQAGFAMFICCIQLKLKYIFVFWVY